MTEVNGKLKLPERDIPTPRSVSTEAQAMLARGGLARMPTWPALNDAASWRATIDIMNTGAVAMFAALAGDAGESVDASDVVSRSVGDATVYISVPRGVADDDNRVVLNLHGGAWVQGGGALCRAQTPARAALFGAHTWNLDYRMPPEDPFPAALDDGVAAYCALLEDRTAQQIVVAGDSAGGNIAAGLMFRLRDEGLPLPAGLVLDSPATDLTASGDTLYTNEGVDPVLIGDFRPTMRLYAGGADLRHPHLSPLFGDFGGGYPSTLLLTGTRDRLLSDTVRLHRALHAAEVPVELHVFEAQGHGGFMGMAPEDLERHAVITRFIAERLAG